MFQRGVATALALSVAMAGVWTPGAFASCEDAAAKPVEVAPATAMECCEEKTKPAPCCCEAETSDASTDQLSLCACGFEPLPSVPAQLPDPYRGSLANHIVSHDTAAVIVPTSNLRAAAAGQRAASHLNPSLFLTHHAFLC